MFYVWKQKDKEFKELPNVIQQISGRAGIQTEIVWQHFVFLLSPLYFFSGETILAEKFYVIS